MSGENANRSGHLHTISAAIRLSVFRMLSFLKCAWIVATIGYLENIITPVSYLLVVTMIIAGKEIIRETKMVMDIADIRFCCVCRFEKFLKAEQISILSFHKLQHRQPVSGTATFFALNSSHRLTFHVMMRIWVESLRVKSCEARLKPKNA